MESYPGLHGRYLQRRLADSMAIRQILCASLPQNRLPAWRILLVEQTFLSAGQGRPRRRETDHAGKTSEGRRIKADALDAIARDILSITGKNCLQRSAMGLRK